MTEEPYRWLEAIGNRREYIRDQLKGGTPVFALSRPEGILLVGVGQGMSKVFEIYDRHGFAAIGHPVDIEKIRQAAIEAAHVEGFNRSARDVTLRRLIGFALSTTLKNAFEQIYSPPIIVESIFAELGETQKEDVLVRVHFDGNHKYVSDSIVVAHTDQKTEDEATAWLRGHIKAEDSPGTTAKLCLTAWRALVDNKPFSELQPSSEPFEANGKVVEAALLDRKLSGPVHYRTIDLSKLKS
jgi:proteasome alpha subunit